MQTLKLQFPDLQLVQQGEKECVYACLASITGLSLKDVKIGYDKINGPATREKDAAYLRTLDIYSCPLAGASICCPGWYMVSLPSLNIKAANHCCLMFFGFLDDEFKLVKVIDPNQGRSGMLTYSAIANEKHEYKPTHWNNMLYISSASFVK